MGPGLWEPPTQEPTWLDDLPRALVLVTCSTEFQNDGKIVEAAIEAFGNTELGVVVTTGSVEFDGPSPPPNVRLERYVPHTPVIRQASCVACHGGMGITQKALAHGVPVCVIPFGRDQPEVARRVQVANAGTSITPGRLNPPRLKRAVAEAMSRKAGAEAIASAFAGAGGPGRAADEIEQLVPSGAAAPRSPTSFA